MFRAAAWAMLLGLALPTSAVFGQSGSTGKRPTAAPVVRNPPPRVIYYPYTFYPTDLVIGELTNGFVLPAAGNGTLFVGTRQPYVLSAPSTFGGPVYIQQPRFFENTVIGGVGGVVSGNSFSRNGIGQNVQGGAFGGTGIGAGGGLSNFNSAFASGINIGINGNAKLGNNGGFLGFQVGPRAAAGPAGIGAGNLAGNVNAGGVNIGFNATGFQAAGRNQAFVNPVVPVIIGGGPGATMSNLTPALGGLPGYGNAERPQRDDGRLTPAEARRLHSAPSMMYWMQEMWKGPTTAGYLADMDKKAREQLFASTLQLLDESVADGRPAKLPDGATVQLVRPTSMVYTSPDGKSSTGWLQGQDMPDVFGLVAVQFYRAADSRKAAK